MLHVFDFLVGGTHGCLGEVLNHDWGLTRRPEASDKWERKRPLPLYPIAPMEKQSIYSGAGYQIRDLLGFFPCCLAGRSRVPVRGEKKHLELGMPQQLGGWGVTRGRGPGMPGPPPAHRTPQEKSSHLSWLCFPYLQGGHKPWAAYVRSPAGAGRTLVPTKQI